MNNPASNWPVLIRPGVAGSPSTRDSGKSSYALELASRAEHAGEKQLVNVLSFASERQRLEFLQRINAYYLLGTLGSAPDLAQAVFHYKGVVLDSLLEDRLIAKTSTDPQQRKIVNQLRAAKQRLTQLELEVPKDVSPEACDRREKEKEKLSKEVEQLEAGLARNVAGLGKARRALSVTVKQVQAALSKDQVLVELLRYGRYLGKSRWEPHYGAIILASSGAPQWVPLGTASLIETNVARYQKAVRSLTGEEGLSDLLQSLSQQIWRPIEQALPTQTRTVILSPDGLLNFLSFATLLTSDDQFLAQKYTLGYVASGRDLLLQPSPAPTPQMAIFADPDFTNTPSIAPPAATNILNRQRFVDIRDLQSLYLAPLPGTARESTELAARGKEWHWPVQVLLGNNATEAQLQAVRSPRILHLATHGFFLPEEADAGMVDRADVRGVGGVRPFSTTGFAFDSGTPRQPHIVLKNPMHRSGLALAGAQRTLEAWKRGKTPDTGNDGIVTAEEVGGLELEGTWLEPIRKGGARRWGGPRLVGGRALLPAELPGAALSMSRLGTY